MNIRSIANRVTKNINPNQKIIWQQSNGYVTDDAGKRTPIFLNLTIEAQIQALSATDLKHIDGLNITGTMRAVYMYGNAAGVVRIDGLGGDILIFPEVPGTTEKKWLITKVMETWPDWCKVIVTLQDEPVCC